MITAATNSVAVEIYCDCGNTFLHHRKSRIWRGEVFRFGNRSLCDECEERLALEGFGMCLIPWDHAAMQRRTNG